MKVVTNGRDYLELFEEFIIQLFVILLLIE
jgi:hypothetical protein